MISSPGCVRLTRGASGPMSTRCWTTSRPGTLRSCCCRSLPTIPAHSVPSDSRRRCGLRPCSFRPPWACVPTEGNAYTSSWHHPVCAVRGHSPAAWIIRGPCGHGGSAPASRQENTVRVSVAPAIPGDCLVRGTQLPRRGTGTRRTTPAAAVTVKFKLDENVPVLAAAILISAGHDVDTVIEEGLIGARDQDVVGAATAVERALTVGQSVRSLLSCLAGQGDQDREMDGSPGPDVPSEP